MLTSYHTDDPVRDAERYAADMEAAIERERRKHVVKCTATIWLDVEHATEDEALEEALDTFAIMFSKVDAEFDCEVEK